jgi:hypothetical protein
VKTLDPGNPALKKQIKASIADAIAKQVVGSSHDEITQRVEETYEKLLGSASILTHVPSLTAGSVRRELMARSRRRPIPSKNQRTQNLLPS